MWEVFICYDSFTGRDETRRFVDFDSAYEWVMSATPDIILNPLEGFSYTSENIIQYGTNNRWVTFTRD